MSRRNAGGSSSRHQLTLIAAGLLALPRLASALDLEVVRLDGSLVRGTLTGVAAGLEVTTDDQPVQIIWDEVLTVRPVGTERGTPAMAASAPTAPLRFSLSDGSEFGGRVTGATERGFVVELVGGQTCRLEPTLVSSIVRADVPANIRTRLTQAAGLAALDDLAIVTRGEKVVELRGVVRQIDAQNVFFNWNQRDVALPWERVAGLLLARAQRRGASTLVKLRGGDAFAGRIIGGSCELLRLQSSNFDGLELPWMQVESIECRSDRLVFLSDLTPGEYEFEPYFAKRWEYARDRSLLGGPVQLQGRAFAKGLALHSRSSLTYELDGQFTQFAGLVGICDDIGPRGAATVRVLTDGRVAWEARSVRAGVPPREVSLRLSGVTQLTLQVDFDEDLDLGDHVCFALARLIR